MQDGIKSTSKEYDKLKLESQLCFPLYAAARKVTALYTPFFKELGITYTQYIVFMVLWEKHSISVGELCTMLYLDSGTVTPLIKKLEQQGYVLRERSHEDERVVIVTLTEKGKHLREKALPVPDKVGTCIPLSIEEAASLYSLLYKLLEKME